MNSLCRQGGGTRKMILPLDVIIRFSAAVMRLEPGDAIATGTPPGVGPLQAGDSVEGAIEGIGPRRKPVGAGVSS